MRENLFGERLKELRTESNLSQKNLALKLGIGKSIISGWELGQNEPTLSKLIAIADFFDVSIDYLAGRKDYWVYFLMFKKYRQIIK